MEDFRRGAENLRTDLNHQLDQAGSAFQGKSNSSAMGDKNSVAGAVTGVTGTVGTSRVHLISPMSVYI